MKFKLASAVVLSILTLGLTACEQNSGNAQSAGEKVDNAVESVKDAVLDKGPAEKAGEKVDNAVEKVKDSTN
jgi:hypothetical protein